MGHKRKIMRFPRKWEDYPSAIPQLQGLSKGKRARAMMQMGLQPKRWRILSNKQKKLLKAIVLREKSVSETLKKYDVHPTTYYQWMNGNIAFRKYHAKLVQKMVEGADVRLDGMLGKALRRVEEALDSRDPYFNYQAALNHLRGRGKYKTRTDVQKDVQQTVTVQGGTNNTNTNVTKLDRETMAFFVEALVGKTKGIEGSIAPPKILDISVLKQLPPPQGPENDEVQVGSKK